MNAAVEQPGAEGEREALSGTGMGERALVVRVRVGAVEPERRALRGCEGWDEGWEDLNDFEDF